VNTKIFNPTKETRSQIVVNQKGPAVFILNPIIEMHLEVFREELSLSKAIKVEKKPLVLRMDFHCKDNNQFGRQKSREDQ
jgi:hypothetical protein